MMRILAGVFAIGPHAGVGEQFALRAVYVEEGFLLSFAKNKMRDWFAVLCNCEPFAGGFGIGAGFDGPFRGA